MVNMKIEIVDEYDSINIFVTQSKAEKNYNKKTKYIFLRMLTFKNFDKFFTYVMVLGLILYVIWNSRKFSEYLRMKMCSLSLNRNSTDYRVIYVFLQSTLTVIRITMNVDSL